ncbi:MAG: DUF6305 family protein [Armatimonadota bacterium]|nr:DUF6305 family protein [Armatimonadota bacterium]
MGRHCLLLVLVCALALPASAAPAFVADPPVLLTSAGQSADFQIVKILFDRLKVPATAKALAGPEDLANARTLVVAIGGSTKGLGAAGIDADGELARVQTLLARAREAKLKVLALHIGGAARRALRPLHRRGAPPERSHRRRLRRERRRAVHQTGRAGQDLAGDRGPPHGRGGRAAAHLPREVTGARRPVRPSPEVT